MELDRLGMEGSMSATGNCSDNAVMERVFGSLKGELAIEEALGTFEEARDMIGGWIEIEYNTARPHSALSYKTPAAFEDSFLGTSEDAP